MIKGSLLLSTPTVKRFQSKSLLAAAAAATATATTTTTTTNDRAVVLHSEHKLRVCLVEENSYKVIKT